VPVTPVPWLQDWARTGVELLAQRDYVARELARIAEAGAAVLTQVLTLPLEMQQHLALSVLHEEGLGGHRPAWRVKLVAGARPPARDPQGRPLPEEDVGKVLVAKLGTRGGGLRQTDKLPDAVTGRFGGRGVQAASHAGEDIYRYVRIGAEPVELQLDEAILVLRQFGHGVQTQRYLNRKDPARMIDQWLLEELSQPFAKKPEATPAKGRAA
jgi:hypothetical protein